MAQGDRKAGPSLSEFNYESIWGQSALKRTYRAILEEEKALVNPPTCRPDTEGRPGMDVRKFWGIARAHLLNVGIIRPGPGVTAIEVLHLSQCKFICIISHTRCDACLDHGVRPATHSGRDPGDGASPVAAAVQALSLRSLCGADQYVPVQPHWSAGVCR